MHHRHHDTTANERTNKPIKQFHNKQHFSSVHNLISLQNSKKMREKVFASLFFCLSFFLSSTFSSFFQKVYLLFAATAHIKISLFSSCIFSTQTIQSKAVLLLTANKFWLLLILNLCIKKISEFQENLIEWNWKGMYFYLFLL